MSDTQLITIEGAIREGRKKGYNRKLRREGKIPGNILGSSTSGLIELDAKWLSKAWKTGKKFNLKMQDEIKPVLIKELQISATKRTALHVDLMYI